MGNSVQTHLEGFYLFIELIRYERVKRFDILNNNKVNKSFKFTNGGIWSPVNKDYLSSFFSNLQSWDTSFLQANSTIKWLTWVLYFILIRRFIFPRMQCQAVNSLYQENNPREYCFATQEVYECDYNWEQISVNCKQHQFCKYFYTLLFSYFYLFIFFRKY